MRILAAVLLLLLVPLASAQSAEPTITVTAGSGAADVSVEMNARVTYTITFDSDNPFDQIQPRRIHLELDGVPEGWTAQLSETELFLSPQASETVSLTVGVTSTATQDMATISVIANVAPLGANGIPGAGPILDPEASASGSTKFTRDESLTQVVSDSLGPWIWMVMIAALVLAVVVAKLVVDRRRIYVALHVPEKDMEIKAGKSLAIPISVENLGKAEDTVVFHVVTISEGWSAALPVPDLDLDGRTTEEMQLIVTAPKDAAPGEAVTVGISAHSAAAPGRVAEGVVTVVVK